MVIKIYNNVGELFPYFPQLYEYYTASSYYTTFGGTAWMAQGFKIGDVGPATKINLSAVQLLSSRVGNPGIFSGSIRSNISGSDLAWGSVNGNNFSDTMGWQQKIIMTPNIILNPNTQYYIVLRTSVPYDFGNCMIWYGQDSGSYDSELSLSSSDSGATWWTSSMPSHSFSFQLLATPPGPGIVNQIAEIKIQRTVVHDIPTANFDIIQSMGTKSRTFALKGYVYTASGSAWLRALPGTTGSMSYTDGRGYNILPATNVFFSKVDFEDRGGRPLERSFVLDAVEVI